MYCECSEGDDSDHKLHSASCPVIQGQWTDFETLKQFIAKVEQRAIERERDNRLSKSIELQERGIKLSEKTIELYERAIEQDQILISKVVKILEALTPPTTNERKS